MNLGGYIIIFLLLILTPFIAFMVGVFSCSAVSKYLRCHVAHLVVERDKSRIYQILFNSLSKNYPFFKELIDDDEVKIIDVVVGDTTYRYACEAQALFSLWSVSARYRCRYISDGSLSPVARTDRVWYVRMC